ncbi:serine/threonine-protein kinase [Streptomyces kanamyceticus]|uniref:Serine/threonine protein kinase n=1 Tax=Streptomyces kanamyceticus TaxID=1967 RepID=A0A5J6GI13_STRKN|nr:serine/threonine-protein kinase [Streptomyces kanamyceticus]QEU93555.1 serine/threonine protein kinase [Streptomyces kanamyceticus]
MDHLTPQDPTSIGEYRLLGLLGEGGMGRVYLARSGSGRTVAVKVVHAEFARLPEFRRRFALEVDAARRVGGTWTAPVLDADTEAPTPWVATGYVPGPDLHAVVAQDYGPLPEHSVRVLANRLAQALQAIHGAGLIHRDLKPSNVLVTVDGPRVIDFGIARALETVTGDDLRTRTGMVIGSPGFMSPEQVRGLKLTPASDVFCLGSVLAYVSTGRQPFGTADSGAHALLFRVAEEEPDLDGVPEGLLGLVRQCLAKDPAQRPTPEEVAARTVTDRGGPWLPGEVLEQLGRHAARLLDLDHPGARAAPVPPVPPARPSVTPTPTAVDPPSSPPPGFGPAPGVEPTTQPAPRTAPSARPAPPRRRRAAVIGAVALVASGVVVSVARPWENDGKEGTSDSAGSVPQAFLGAWEGEVENDGGLARIEVTKGEGGGPVARIYLTTSDDQCFRTSDWVVSSGPAGGSGLKRLTLGEALSGSTDVGGCSAIPEHTLKTRPDGKLDWSTKGGGYSAVLKKERLTDKPVPKAFLGTWRDENEDIGQGRRITFTQGPFGSAVVHWTSSDAKNPKTRCEWKAELTSVRGKQLSHGPIVLDSAKSGSTCEKGADSITYTALGPDKLEMRPLSGTGQGSGAPTYLERVDR